MNVASPAPSPRRWSRLHDLKTSLVFAGLMLAIPVALNVASRLGWETAPTLKQRLLMVLVGVYLASTGNDIPKRIAARTCAGADPARLQSFHRFTGWTWVLAGLGLAVAWIALPQPSATLATLLVMPMAIVLTTGAWLRLRSETRDSRSSR